ncbi:MAG: FIST N-terminal domain-containing protein [Rhodobacter sp.]|nr:FIST N-terminal domain-containing protein [Rhodobacter sp.]
MDGNRQPSIGGVSDGAVVRTAHVSLDTLHPISAIAHELGAADFALVALFVSPEADFPRLVQAAQAQFGECPVIGCTTAGEISDFGYSDNGIVAVALPAEFFAVETLCFDGLDRLHSQDVIGDVIRARAALGQAVPQMAHEFAFLLVDGLSLKEDELASALASGLGPMPLFGGSAGDGTRFRTTMVACGGSARDNAAVLTLVRSHCRAKVFTLNHFTPTDQRMVVTSADPSRRIVHTINAEPAARELGRILGKDPEQIDTFTFASNPVVVRFGGDHHVRAIKRVTEDGDLEFFSAIDEGLVLTLADAENMAEHLQAKLGGLSTEEKPDTIIACDCILRRIEAEQKQMTRAIGDVLGRYHVAGFSTYGEQIGAMHVNQTMTGVAIYPPDPA